MKNEEVALPKKRFTVDMSKQMATLMEGLAKDMETNKGEVVRLSLSLMKAAQDAKKDGLRVGAVSDEEREHMSREFVGL